MTEQLREWKNKFGKEYTKRNLITPEGVNRLFKQGCKNIRSWNK